MGCETCSALMLSAPERQAFSCSVWGNESRLCAYDRACYRLPVHDMPWLGRWTLVEIQRCDPLSVTHAFDYITIWPQAPWTVRIRVWQHVWKYASREKAETYMILNTQLNKKIKRITYLGQHINQVLLTKKDVYQCCSELTICQLQKYSMNSSIFKTTCLR